MEFLLELLVEELPVSHSRTALEQLGTKFKEELCSARVEVKDLKTYGTPRRLIVTADLSAGQPDTSSVVTGPPRAAGYDADGKPTKAALGFARGHNLTEADLQIVKTPKGEYLGFKKVSKGRPTEAILAEIVPRILGSLTFPKMMKWGASPMKFSRPVHGLLCVFDGKTVDCSFAGHKAGTATIGHRIISPVAVEARTFAEYKDRLAANGVIIDQRERRDMVIRQTEGYLAEHKAKVHPDEELLDKLIMSVEHPQVIFGGFPEEYLVLPIEVLSTSMREGQELFSVVRDKKQLPLFIGVADSNADSRGLIRAGNERVLKARLADARFFWEQDRKTPLAKRAPGLKDVVFQEKLGTYEDKVQRMKKIAAYLCDKIDAAKIKNDAVEAAGLSKVDLLTDMVREFPGLQGRMGGLYAKLEGFPAAVWQAVYDQYKPVGLDDDPPSSTSGAVVALADKMDSIVGAMGVGVEVKGSSDPFGLRRQTQGVCKIIFERKLEFSFNRLVAKIVTIYGDKLVLGKNEIEALCVEFFEGRLRFMLERMGYRYDLVSAAIGPGIEHINKALLRVKALDSLKSSSQFEAFILMAKRVKNILKGQTPGKVNPDLFTEKEERELYSTFAILRDNVEPMIEKGDFGRAQNMIFKLQPVLNTFFEKVMVMAEDKKTRQNRLGLLNAIDSLLSRIADYSQVVVEGEKGQNV